MTRLFVVKYFNRIDMAYFKDNIYNYITNNKEVDMIYKIWLKEWLENYVKVSVKSEHTIGINRLSIIIL